MDRPKLFDVGQKRQIAVDNTLFSNPWRINQVRWRPDSRSFSFLYNERGHQVMRIVSVDSITGQVHLIVDESSQTFIDYSGKQFSSYHDPSDSLIWMSERDGWNHLYLIDLKEGQVKRQLTKGDWVVRGVDRVDWELGKVWVRIGGYYSEQDPYYVHHAVVDLLDGGLTLLTRGDGDHEIEFLKGGAWLVDRYSRVDMPMVAELRNAKTGELVCELERGDCSRLLETGWKLPERFQAKGRDGVTNIYGVIYRPSNFQPEKSPRSVVDLPTDMSPRAVGDIPARNIIAPTVEGC